MPIQISIEEIIAYIVKFFWNKRKTQEAIIHFCETLAEENSILNREQILSEGEPGWGRYLLNIEQAFVPMNMSTHEVGQTSETLASVYAQNRKLLIVGQAGSGKSTLVRYITFLMAKAYSEPGVYKKIVIKELGDDASFPIYVELRNASTQSLQVLISKIRIPSTYLEEQKNNGRLLLVLDGLDEIASFERQAEVIAEINELTLDYTSGGRGNRIIVTTRSTNHLYRKLGAYGYIAYHLQNLTKEQKRNMVQCYYQAWMSGTKKDAQKGLQNNRENWQVRANKLIEQLESNNGLNKLSSNALLLSQIIYLHYQGEMLPAQKQELYRQCIISLVARKDYEAEPSPERIEERLDILGEVGLSLHQRKEVSSFSFNELLQVLISVQDLYKGNETLQGSLPEFIELLEKKWAVLRKTESNYVFVHQSFQEYLTARLIARYPKQYLPILQRNLQDTWWQEVILLYTAIDPDAVDTILNNLLNEISMPSDELWLKAGLFLANNKRSSWFARIMERLRLISNSEGSKGALALEALCLIEPEGIQWVIDEKIISQYTLFSERVLQHLQKIQNHESRQQLREALIKRIVERPLVKERIVLATALGQLGDIRLDQMLPINSKALKKQFSVGKYPVTNVQYADFIKATNRVPPPDWSNGQYSPGKANHPVVSVTFRDAQAYCEWFSSQTGKQCSLPSIKEWMMIGSEENSGLKFPWGSRYDQGFLNTGREGKCTTPVGIYLEGETDAGVSDLLGNVWEWTTSEKGNGYIVKGLAYDTGYIRELVGEGIFAEMVVPADERRSNVGFRIIEH
ncbi:MAG: SUMF1/EgtB/PvdO family nonheme iron enzyme [Chloroflexi bacterium]|nr:SUMF1/EgtB/PvdO family nonheme iron enzyme [Chloroflexota bacterium]